MAQDRANDDIERQQRINDVHLKEHKRLFDENLRLTIVLAKLNALLGFEKADVCPDTATEQDCSQDGINDRGSDQYASPCTHFSKMSINGQVQCYDCGKYFDDE